MKQKIEIEIDVPEGYEATGEFRQPRKGEFILRSGSAIEAMTDNEFSEGIILRKVKRYREPVLPADLGKVCEFSDNETHWFEGNLIGLITTDYGIRWQRAVGLYQRCRIEVDR